MNSVPKLFSCSYADCWTEKHFSTEFGVLTPNHTHSHTLFWGCVSRWFGRALAWHARGHRFDPGNLHTEALHEKSRSAFYFVSKQVYHDSPNTVQDQSWSSQECSGCSTYNRNIRRKVSGANQTQYAQNHWDSSKSVSRNLIASIIISESQRLQRRSYELRNRIQQ